MKLLSRTAAAAVVMVVCVSGASAIAAPSDADAFSYGGSVGSGGAVDDSGLGNSGLIEAVYGGSVTEATDPSLGAVLRFPQAICTRAPKGGSCPRATVNPLDQSGLNPVDGTGDFQFGATVRMSTVAGTAGMNIMQRGTFTAGQPQWKLQTDYRSAVGFRVASCRFADGTSAVLIFGTKRLVAGTWYALSCARSGNTFSLVVDQLSGTTADETVSVVAALTSIAPTGNAIIGAKAITPVVGQTDKVNDQFHGDLDTVFFGRR